MRVVSCEQKVVRAWWRGLTLEALAAAAWVSS